MEPKTIALAALRVLSAWSKGITPAPKDLKILRAHAVPEEVDLPTDVLACRIVARTCQEMVQKSPVDHKETEAEVGRRRRKSE